MHLRLLLPTLFGCALVACASTAAPVADAAPPLDTAAPADAGTPLDASEAPRSALELRVATWNIEQFPKSEATAARVRATIEEQALDLVAVQEIVDVSAFVDLARQLPDHDYALSYDRDAYLQHGLLYRTSRLELLSVTRGFTRDSYAFPRDPLVAQLRVRDDEGDPRFEFAAVVVHLKAGIGAEDRRRREQATAALDEWVRTLAAAQPDVVILGDFNDVLDDPAAATVFRPFASAPETYRVLTAPQARAGVYSYIPARVLLDHVIITSDVLEEYGDGDTRVLPLDEADPRYEPEVSDHRPVVATFRIP